MAGWKGTDDDGSIFNGSVAKNDVALWFGCGRDCFGERGDVSCAANEEREGGRSERWWNSQIAACGRCGFAAGVC